eukprot:ANDGO_04004.mRNA.1 Secretory immunoglobulin A-binding protein EsiB
MEVQIMSGDMMSPSRPILLVIAAVVHEAHQSKPQLGSWGDRLVTVLDSVQHHLSAVEEDLQNLESSALGTVSDDLKVRFFQDQRTFLHDALDETLGLVLKVKYMKMFKESRSTAKAKDLIYFLELRCVQLLWAIAAFKEADPGLVTSAPAEPPLTGHENQSSPLQKGSSNSILTSPASQQLIDTSGLQALSLCELSKRVYVEATVAQEHLGKRKDLLLGALHNTHREVSVLKEVEPGSPALQEPAVSEAVEYLRKVLVECFDHVKKSGFITKFRNIRTRKSTKELVWKLESRVSILSALVDRARKQTPNLITPIIGDTRADPFSRSAASAMNTPGPKSGSFSADGDNPFADDSLTNTVASYGALCDIARKVAQDAMEAKSQLAVEPHVAQNFVQWIVDIRDRLLAVEADLPIAAAHCRARRWVADTWTAYQETAKIVTRAKSGKSKASNTDLKSLMRILDLKTSYLRLHVSLSKERDEELQISDPCSAEHVERDFFLPAKAALPSGEEVFEAGRLAFNVEKDKERAYELWVQAGKLGYEPAFLHLARSYYADGDLQNASLTYFNGWKGVGSAMCLYEFTLMLDDMNADQRFHATSFVRSHDLDIESSFFVSDNLLSLAAEAGHADSCFRVAMMIKSRGQNRTEEVIGYLERCLELDPEHWEGMNALAVLLISRLPSLEGAKMKWNPVSMLERAAEHCVSDAHFNLGVVWEVGLAGSPRDLSKAREWYTKSAGKGNPEGRASLGYLLMSEGSYVASRRELVVAAEMGSASAKYYIALMYLFEMGVPRDLDIAFCYLSECVSLSTNSKNVLFVQDVLGKAHCRIGDMLYSGIGCVRNVIAAAENYRKASDLGSAEAANNLALMLSSGIGVEASYAEAERYFRLATAAGDRNAPYNHSVVISERKGMTEEALLLLRTAAQRGNTDAVVMLEGLGYGTATFAPPLDRRLYR